VLIDYSPLASGDQKLMQFAAQYTVEDLQQIASGQVDFLLEQIKDLTDADVVFDPVDPNAHDPYAKAGEEHIGWSLAHLVAHVTASSEEWVTYSSVLARGIAYPAEPRLRYETEWRSLTTVAQVIQRLEESRRMRLGYLAAWPDQPDMDTRRTLSPRFIERFGEFNAPAAFLFGLYHEWQHFDQIKDARAQALAGRSEVAAR
jgi:hypothetical protein